jgi:hypothetical protein
MGLPRRLKTRAADRAAPTGFAGRLGGLSGRWKLAAAGEAVEEEPGRRIMWVDDDLVEQAADIGDWLARPHVLVVAPDLYVDVTHEKLDAIEAWL